MRYLKTYKIFESRIPPTFTKDDISTVFEILMELDTYGIEHSMVVDNANLVSSLDDIRHDEYNGFSFAIGKRYTFHDVDKVLVKDSPLIQYKQETSEIIYRIFTYLMEHGSENSPDFGYYITIYDKYKWKLMKIDNRFITLKDLMNVLVNDEYHITEIIIEID